MLRCAIRIIIEPSSLLGFARLVVGWLPAEAGSIGWAGQAPIRGGPSGIPARSFDCLSDESQSQSNDIKSVRKS
jgi:hypothetical protein